MTGGEPFLYPDFVQVCRRLAEKHWIAVDTNMSLTDRIRDFARSIPPARVADLYVALHIEERERRGEVPAFIENVTLLKEHGFHVSVNYVIHPTLADRFPDDERFFRERGIRLIPRPFKGKYQGRDYPAGYDEKAKALFSSKPSAGRKMVYNFQGVPCRAGRDLIRLEPDGTVLRCPGERTALGNILSSVRLYDRPVPCGVSRCPCFGADYTILNKGQERFLSGLRNDVLDRRIEARSDFEKTIALDPESSNALNNLGVLCRKEGAIDQAGRYFHEALTRHPGNKVYLVNRLTWLARADRAAEARELGQAFLEQGPDPTVENILDDLDRGAPIAPSDLICVDVIPVNSRKNIFPKG